MSRIESPVITGRIQQLGEVGYVLSKHGVEMTLG